MIVCVVSLFVCLFVRCHVLEHSITECVCQLAVGQPLKVLLLVVCASVHIPSSPTYAVLGLCWGGPGGGRAQACHLSWLQVAGQTVLPGLARTCAVPSVETLESVEDILRSPGGD